MDYVRCIKIFSEERIISGSEDGELKIWCLKTNSCIQTINAHSKIIREIQILSDNQVASCSYDKRIILRNFSVKMELIQFVFFKINFVYLIF